MKGSAAAEQAQLRKAVKARRVKARVAMLGLKHLRAKLDEARKHAEATVKHAKEVEDQTAKADKEIVKLKKQACGKVTQFEKDIVKAKKEKKPKKEKDPSKPKRAATGYLLFSAEIRPEIREELTQALDEDEKLKPQAVVQAIAVRWKALEPHEKEEWNARAKELASSNSEASSSAKDGAESDLAFSDDDED